MQYGITPYGFIMKRGSDILTEMRQDYQTLFTEIDLDDDSVVTQAMGIQAKQLSELWEVGNAVYNSTYPNSAEGQSLDYVCELNAITRLGSTRTRAIVGAKGTNGTIINANLPFRVQNAAKTITFGISEDFTINDSSAIQSKFLVSTVQDNTIYSLIIDGHTVQITSGISETAITIAEKIHDEINFLSATVGVTASLPSPADGHFIIISNDGISPFSVTFTANLSRTEFYTPFTAFSLETGEFNANAGTITYILTPVSGLESIYNFVDAEKGRFIENDTELRFRRAQNIRIVGACTIEAIKARINNDVLNVKQCRVYENDEDFSDIEGRPPHSIEVLVLGGDVDDIANEIWLVKGGGIKTFGDISYIIVDSMNESHVINFSRPVEKYIWVRITLQTDSQFPADGEDEITNNMLGLAQSRFGIGDDVLIQTLYCPIYSVKGITSALIEIAVTDDLNPPVTYVTANIPIGNREASAWDSSRITYLII